MITLPLLCQYSKLSTHRTDMIKPIFHCDAKPLMLWVGVGQYPQRKKCAFGIPTCWYLRTLKFALPPKPNLKLALPPMRTPNVNQWNIGCVGKIIALAMYISFFSVSILFALGPVFQWNMGFKVPKVIFNIEAPSNTRNYLAYSSYCFPFVWSGISV